jgi:hypothetical protein
VIYIIEVDKHERRAVLLPVPNSRLRRWGGAWFVSHDVRSLRLQQIGKARPIVEHGDAARGVLGAQHAENSGNLPSSARQVG